MEMGLYYLLDALGTVAFAMSGAFKAVRHRLDLLGVLVLGFATAMGGGVVRDILIGHTPIAFRTNGPALFSLLGCVLAGAWPFAARRLGHPLELEGERTFLVVDALGLAIFAVTGARLGAEAGLTAWSTIILAATTGVGGGMIRDILVQEVPLVLKADFYATAALIGGLVFVVLDRAGVPAPAPSVATFLVTFLLRVLAIRHRWRLPLLPT
jgi:uncharacterized membrane protein YeiH